MLNELQSAEQYYGMKDTTIAIGEIEKLMKAQKHGSKAYEYYYSIYQVLCSLGTILLEVEVYKRENKHLWQRMEILEKKFLLK